MALSFYAEVQKKPGLKPSMNNEDKRTEKNWLWPYPVSWQKGWAMRMGLWNVDLLFMPSLLSLLELLFFSRWNKKPAVCLSGRRSSFPFITWRVEKHNSSSLKTHQFFGAKELLQHTQHRIFFLRVWFFSQLFVDLWREAIHISPRKCSSQRQKNLQGSSDK